MTIPTAERDRLLGEKLKAEWSGILSWMIQGCAEWQASGLQPPEVVTKATASYLEAEDAIGTWVDERCRRDPQAGSKKNFVQSLEARGYRPHRTHVGRGFYGLRII